MNIVQICECSNLYLLANLCVNTTVSDWAWTRVIRTRMFLVRNVRVAMQKLPRFQGQTFSNVNIRITIDQTKKFALGNVAVSA